MDIIEQNVEDTQNKYVNRYMQDKDRLTVQPTKISRMKVNLSDIPLELLFNKHTNMMKATEVNGVTDSFVPIHFKLEHDSFIKQNGSQEVTFTTQINGVDIEVKQMLKDLKKRSDNSSFKETLRVSRPERTTFISNHIGPRLFSHLSPNKQLVSPGRTNRSSTLPF